MEPRIATPDDAPELVRLAAMMFASMGLDVSDPAWLGEAERAVRERAGDDDMVAFVIDHPSKPGVLIASGAATIANRLPGPMNPSGTAAYVQWMSVEPGFQRQGHGRTVLRALIAWARDRNVGLIDLHATEAGEPLYRSEGFGDPIRPQLRLKTPD